jgi:hypothetical protein
LGNDEAIRASPRLKVVCLLPFFQNVRIHQEDTIRAGGVTQVVECLPNKSEALSSNPSMAKKKKKRHNL